MTDISIDDLALFALDPYLRALDKPLYNADFPFDPTSPDSNVNGSQLIATSDTLQPSLGPLGVGFYASAYRTDNDEIVISYRGTDDIWDWALADIPMVLGGLPTFQGCLVSTGVQFEKLTNGQVVSAAGLWGIGHP
jgi:hypothetical protein